jgi:hypothetical protein
VINFFRKQLKKRYLVDTLVVQTLYCNTIIIHKFDIVTLGTVLFYNLNTLRAYSNVVDFDG